MNNGITGDNDLNLSLNVAQGQMNYSAITNSSTCFIVRARALALLCAAPCSAQAARACMHGFQEHVRAASACQAGAGHQACVSCWRQCTCC